METEKKGANWRLFWVIVAVAVTVLAASAVGIYFLIAGVMKGSDAYKMSLQMLEANTRAMQVLGPPITTGMPMGSINTNGPSGNAEFAIPVQGQKASGTLYVVATKAMGVWKADRLELHIDRGERIDLIRDGTPI